jgi:hypothetical protein
MEKAGASLIVSEDKEFDRLDQEALAHEPDFDIGAALLRAIRG